jgi:glycosyltransferase involved in cell wall biosynthesis
VRLGLYLADQVWARTRSKGIYSYSRLLAAELPARLPQHDWTLFVNAANRADMDAHGVRIVELPAACASGLPRVAADNALAPLLAWRHRLDLVHFPKGFIPWLGPGAWFTATIHDTIPLYYAQHHPGYFPDLQVRYFAAAIRRGLRRARAIVTDSEFSRAALHALASDAGIAPPRIEVCPPSPDPRLVDDGAEPADSGRRRLVHMGSVLPHKRTPETIALFRRFNQRAGGGWVLRVVGLEGPAAGPDVEMLGPLGLDALRAELRAARALLLFSAIEGFGLPALEAWFLGTPVCYVAPGAVAEVLEGVPGGCASLHDDAFASALDAVLALSAADRARYRDRLRARYGRERFGERMAGWLRSVLGG